MRLELPPATFRDPELDLERSYVYDRDRGAIDRIGSIFGDDSDLERELYALAEEKLASAARDDSGLLDRAERNTRRMLEGLLRRSASRASRSASPTCRPEHLTRPPRQPPAGRVTSSAGPTVTSISAEPAKEAA